MKAKLRGLISLSETTTEILNSNHESVISTSAAIPFLIAEQSTHQPILLVAHSSKRASDLVAEISEFIDGVMEFPAWETLPHERLSPNSDTVAKRIHTLLHLEDAKVVVSTARALVQPIISSITTTPLLNLEIGKEFNFEALLRELTLRAYSRVDLVERRGDFAVRGGIIDVFPPLAQHPVRIEFFGDEIEDMKYFEISDQRTFAPVIGTLTLIPCKEILITQEVQARAGELKSQYLELREMCSKIESGIYVDGIESLAAVLHPEMKTLIDFLPNNFSVVILESERIKFVLSISSPPIKNFSKRHGQTLRSPARKLREENSRRYERSYRRVLLQILRRCVKSRKEKVFHGATLICLATRMILRLRSLKR
ncbi:MAG: hypothetical protein RLZZ35_1007 [Actinomycetota bacterium]